MTRATVVPQLGPEVASADELRILYSHRADFDKGTVAWLSGKIEPGSMSLRAFLTPRTLKRLART